MSIEKWPSTPSNQKLRVLLTCAILAVGLFIILSKQKNTLDTRMQKPLFSLDSPEKILLPKYSSDTLFVDERATRTYIERFIAQKTDYDANKRRELVDQFIQASVLFDIPIRWLVSHALVESRFATTGRAVVTNNILNVGNVDDGTNRVFETSEIALYAASANYANRMYRHRMQYGDGDTISFDAIILNQWPDGRWFLPTQDNYQEENDYRWWWKNPYGAYFTDSTATPSIQSYVASFPAVLDNRIESIEERHPDLVYYEKTVNELAVYSMIPASQYSIEVLKNKLAITLWVSDDMILCLPLDSWWSKQYQYRWMVPDKTLLYFLVDTKEPLNNN